MLDISRDSAGARPGLAAYLRANETVRDEVDIRLRVAEGALPSALRGVLYRNGPGKMEVHGTKYDHPFDGDGMVTRFAFADGEVHYKNRFVRTEEYVAEERAGRMLYRSFGTNLPGGLRKNLFRLRFKNAANTSVVLHGGKLVGMLSDRDLHLVESLQGVDPEKLRVEEAMSSTVYAPATSSTSAPLPAPPTSSSATVSRATA